MWYDWVQNYLLGWELKNNLQIIKSENDTIDCIKIKQKNSYSKST